MSDLNDGDWFTFQCNSCFRKGQIQRGAIKIPENKTCPMCKKGQINIWGLTFSDKNTIKLQNIADIVEENGKTVRENNKAKQHNIPIGTLVEVKYIDLLSAAGAIKKVHARLYVYSHDRDCDGTPLYSLSKAPLRYEEPYTIDNDTIYKQFHDIHPKYAELMFYDPRHGFAEDDLTPIEMTQAIVDGDDSLTDWEDDPIALNKEDLDVVVQTLRSYRLILKNDSVPTYSIGSFNKLQKTIDRLIELIILKRDPKKATCPACRNGVKGKDSLCDDCYKADLGTHIGGR